MNEMYQPQKVSVPDDVIALGVEITTRSLQQNISEIAPLWQQATQIVMSKSPQPQVDMAVQKTFEAAMADIQRKQQVDMNNAKMDQMRLMVERERMQADQANKQFEQGQVTQQLQRDFQHENLKLQNEMRMFVDSMNLENEKLRATIDKNNKEFMAKMIEIEQENQKIRQESDAKSKEYALKLEELLHKKQSEIIGKITDSIPSVDQGQGMVGSAIDNMKSIMENVGNMPGKTEIIQSPDGNAIGIKKTMASSVAI